MWKLSVKGLHYAFDALTSKGLLSKNRDCVPLHPGRSQLLQRGRLSSDCQYDKHEIGLGRIICQAHSHR